MQLIPLWQCNLFHYCNATPQRGILLFFIGARKMANLKKTNRIFHFSLCAKPNSRKSLLAEWPPLLLVLQLTWIMGGRICGKNVYWGEEGVEEKTLQEIARWKGISIDRYILYIAIESYTDNDEKLMTWNISHPVCPIVSQSAGPLFSLHSCCQNRLEQNLRGI